MEIVRDQIKAELKFNGTYFTCSIPFAAVWGLTSERSEFAWWPQSTPEQVLSTLSQAPSQRQSDQTKPEAQNPKPMPATTSVEKTPVEDAQPSELPRGKPVLKRVK
jgi:hypothetical protein